MKTLSKKGIIARLRGILSSDDGFTLIEILISMGIFAVALLGVVQVFYYAMVMNNSSKQVTTSANIARKEMDFFKLMSMAELDAYPANGQKKIDVNNDGADDYLYDWTITKTDLGWGEDYERYVVMVEVRPRGVAPNTRVGRDVTYRMRSVLLRHPDDQNQ